MDQKLLSKPCNHLDTRIAPTDCALVFEFPRYVRGSFDHSLPAHSIERGILSHGLDSPFKRKRRRRRIVSRTPRFRRCIPLNVRPARAITESEMGRFLVSATRCYLVVRLNNLFPLEPYLQELLLTTSCARHEDSIQHSFWDHCSRGCHS